MDRERLYARLQASDPAERASAARALLSLNEDPWARGGLIAAVLMDAEVRRIVRERLGAALDVLYPPGVALASLDGWSPPEFPWPPPVGYSRFVVPRDLFTTGGGEATLGHVYNALVDALEAASDGFEHGLFVGVPGGFALVARMERIRRDGTPLPEPARWMKEGSPKLSLVEFLGDLFFERPGYFRVIAFAITDDLMPGEDTGARLPEPREGAPTIPPELAEKPFDNQEVLALIYSFERRGSAKITPWRDGAPSVRQHLKLAGVWASLEVASTSP